MAAVGLCGGGGVGSRSPASVSSASPRGADHVSGLGISSASSSSGHEVNQGPVAVAAVQRGRVQDRLVWEEPRPSRKAMWRRRKERQREAGPSRPPMAPEMFGRCFTCLRKGHPKRECTNDIVCIRCGEDGHGSGGCTRPRSPSSADELRGQALAKVARRETGPARSPPRASAPLAAPGGAPRFQGQQGGRLPALGGASRELGARPPGQGGAPRDLGKRPLVAAAAQPPAAAREVADAEAPLCVVRRTRNMEDLERRLRFAMVAYVGGARPAVSCEQVADEFYRAFDLPANAFSVHRYLPESITGMREEHIVVLRPTAPQH